MKSKYFKYLEKTRKSYLASNKFRNKEFNKDGIYVYHDYSHNKPDDLSWWDDVGFKLGKNYYVILWQHPRMKYKDMCEDIAHIKSNDLYLKIKNDIFKNAEITYEKVGKKQRLKNLFKSILT